MELRQLRYFVKVVELGSMGQAAQSLGVVTSALSQQISRLESELSTVLLRRSATGVTPTEAGLAFWQQAQLALRHVDEAVNAAQNARLSGHVRLGLTPTTASVLGVPLLKAMRAQYPDVRLQVVESLSGNLSAMLNARLLDLAIVFQGGSRGRWLTQPLLNEQLLLMVHEDLAVFPDGKALQLDAVAQLPLVLPSGTHGLRAVLNAAFERAQAWPNLLADVDGLALLMDIVQAGIAATVQPGSAMARITNPALHAYPLDEPTLRRVSYLATLPEEELSPAALALRRTILDVASDLVNQDRWPGASLHES